MIKIERIPFVILSLLCLLTGLWAGLNRIGWNLFTLPGTAHHGAIMVGGFLGSLIALEKIIPLKKKILYGIPALSILSVLFFLLSYSVLSITLLILSSTGLTAVFIYYLYRAPKMIYILMVLGALSWLTGNILLFTTFFYPSVFAWWAAFILFVIVAERLEIMQFLPVSKGMKRIFFVLLIFFAIGSTVSFHGHGNKICGLSLIGITIWLMRYDVVGITIRKRGLTQFTAMALVSGYFALLLTGILYIASSNNLLSYDAIVHSFFVGFAFSMIFAHGPIILPSVLGIIAKPFHKSLYLWLLLLHCSWVLRIIADFTLEMDLRRISGLMTVIAIIGYFITMGILTRLSVKHQRQ